MEAEWPTRQSRHAWLQFYKSEVKGNRRKWSRETQLVRVEWSQDVPAPGTHVVIEPNVGGVGDLVLSPDFVQMGIVTSFLRRPHRSIVGARVADKPRTVVVEFFGPSLPN